MVVERTRRFNVLLTEEEHRMLQDLADFHGLTASDYFRQHLREQHAATEEPRGMKAFAAAQDRQAKKNAKARGELALQLLTKRRNKK